jgi:hypothetical protein
MLKETSFSRVRHWKGYVPDGRCLDRAPQSLPLLLDLPSRAKTNQRRAVTYVSYIATLAGANAEKDEITNYFRK